MSRLKQRIENFRTQPDSLKKYSAVFAFVIVLTLICEVFVFNFKWIGSAFDKELNITPQVTSGGTVSGNEISITSDSATIRFSGVNSPVKYLRFSPDKGSKAEITVSAVDQGNSAGLSAPQRVVLGDVPRSQYIRLHFSGEVKSLNISVSGMSGRSVSLDNIGLNVHVPFMLSWARFVILSLLIMLLYLLRPKSFVYKYKTNLKDKRQVALVLAVVLVQGVFFWNMIHWNKTAIGWHENYEHHQQYYDLIEAFKDGHLYLNKEVPQKLQNLDNPYDYSSRMSAVSAILWDNAYYNGKCYVYFGAAPALLLYLPYNLITGGNLPNYAAVFIFGIMILLGIMLLLWEVIKKWFKDTPLGLYLILSTVFGAISALGYAVYKPDFYLVPIVAAVMFGLFGLALWISAEQTDQKGETRIVPWRLGLGSLLIALIAGCRPQLLIIIAIGIMFYWKAVFKERTLFSKSSVKQTTALCLPFVVVAAAVMWYNYARFGSPFDFGANYNLTTNDMTARGLVWGRNGLGLFSYLVQPLNIDAVFPFLNDFKPQTAYQGLTLTEMMVGGIFWLFPILLIGIYGAFKKNSFRDRRAHRLVYFSLAAVVLLAALDAQMAGLLTRYFTDFVWLACLATGVTVLAYYEMLKDKPRSRNRLVGIVLVLSVVSVAMAFLRIFAHTEDSIMNANPVLYYSVQHLIAFWL